MLAPAPAYRRTVTACRSAGRGRGWPRRPWPRLAPILVLLALLASPATASALGSDPVPVDAGPAPRTATRPPAGPTSPAADAPAPDPTPTAPDPTPAPDP